MLKINEICAYAREMAAEFNLVDGENHKQKLFLDGGLSFALSVLEVKPDLEESLYKGSYSTNDVQIDMVVLNDILMAVKN